MNTEQSIFYLIRFSQFLFALLQVNIFA